MAPVDVLRADLPLDAGETMAIGCDARVDLPGQVMGMPIAAEGGGGATNLPAPPTPLVGREREVEAVRLLLSRADVRLVTLTGPGGVGKTRLAFHAAAGLVDHFADGVWLVRLAAIRDPEMVLPAIGRALGVPEAGGRSMAAALVAALRDRHRLLLLDNMEQVVAVAPRLAELLAACPKLKLLVTSRASLRLRAEHEYPVPPLSLPAPPDHAPAQSVDLAAAEASPAVTLFVVRARAVDPRFALTAENAADVTEICRRLDGLPLAIELAAARVKLLGPRALLARLDGRSPAPLLSGGARDLPQRQQTLRDAIAWSYDLLSDEERALFRRLAVFAGGFTFDAAEEVGLGPGAPWGAASGSNEHSSPASVLDLLESLVDKNLLRQREEADGESRFLMLQTIRDFGLAELAAAGEEAATRRAHAAHFLALAERVEPELIGPAQALWMDRLAADLNNLRLALEWAVEAGEAATALRLAAALWRFWVGHGLMVEGRGWLERALAVAEDPDCPLRDHATEKPRAKALQHAANLALDLGDYTQARVWYEAALSLRRELEDELGTASSLNGLGLLAAYGGDNVRARTLHEEALAIRRRLGDRQGLGNSLSNLGSVAACEGAYDRAQALHEEALALRRAMGDRGAAAYSVFNLGELARIRGEVAAARARFEESLTTFREVRDKLGAGYALHGLGRLALAQGDAREAAARFREVLTLRREIGDQRGLVECLEGVTALVVAGFLPGVAERAARLAGAAATWREALAAPLPPADRHDHERVLTAARAELGSDLFAEAWAEGRRLALEQALTEAAVLVDELAEEVPPASASDPDEAGYPAGLSEREIEVLQLVAAGLTNAQVGERLFISPRTVNAHLQRIYGKLDVTTRAGATRFALEHGLA